jgi:N-acetylglucosaminyldiphosphoundecaprenol N-acetyl-beta-D-mannosaminyltransferase
MAQKIEFPRHEVLGVHIHAATMTQVLDVIDAAIRERKHLMVGVVNAAKIINMRKNPELSADVNGSDLVLADGISVVLASRVLGCSLPERVAGIDLMHGMLERGSRAGYRVYCLGATEETSAEVERRFTKMYPGVRIVGRRNGYFSEDEEQAIAEDIGSRDVDILLVAMTSPKKERFMARWRDTINARVVHGVGGSFDVVAGYVHRAPQSWQKLGLEWLYRVKQEPRRLWKRYLTTSATFLRLLTVAWLARLVRGG